MIVQSANPDHTQECIDRRHGHRPVYNTETDKRHPAMVFSIEQRNLQLNCGFMRLMCDSISERRATASTDFGSKRISELSTGSRNVAKHFGQAESMTSYGARKSLPSPASKSCGHTVQNPLQGTWGTPRNDASLDRPAAPYERIVSQATVDARLHLSRYPILKSHRPDCLDGNTCHRTDDLVSDRKERM